MEQQITKAVMLLEEKKLAFLKYEAITDSLSEAVEIEVMDDYITKRAELANKIDKLDDMIKKPLTELLGDGWKLALTASVQREGLPEELRPIYDINQSILDIVRRIRLKNSDLTAGYQRQRQELSEKIKATSNMPKINRYLNNLSTPDEINNFGSV